MAVRSDLDLAEVLSIAHESRLLDVFTALPAIVQSYDPATNTVVVQPAVKRRLETEDGDAVHETLPLIQNVTVVWPGGGGFELRFPIGSGDAVLLVFSQWADNVWRDSGQVSEPVDVTKHGPSYPKAFPFSRAASYGSAAAQMVCPSPFTFGDVAAAQFAALSTKVDQNFQTLLTVFNAHMHPTAGAGAPSPPATLLTPFAATACAKLKSE